MNRPVRRRRLRRQVLPDPVGPQKRCGDVLPKAGLEAPRTEKERGVGASWDRRRGGKGRVR